MLLRLDPHFVGVFRHNDRTGREFQQLKRNDVSIFEEVFALVLFDDHIRENLGELS